VFIVPIVRKPKVSEMSLSTQVKQSVDAASDNLRDALAFAARSEHPIIIGMLSDVISRLETMEHMDDFMEKFGVNTVGKEIQGPN
jgi:hypothetical protein